MGPGEPGQPRGLPGHAPSGRRSPDRGGREAAALDDGLDPATQGVGMMPRFPVAREGWPFILLPGAMAVGLALLGRRKLALPFAAASLASLGFFRDPEREVPALVNAALSPADGRVTSVD